jgi:hypothetical protein
MTHGATLSLSALNMLPAALAKAKGQVGRGADATNRWSVRNASLVGALADHCNMAMPRVAEDTCSPDDRSRPYPAMDRPMD